MNLILRSLFPCSELLGLMVITAAIFTFTALPVHADDSHDRPASPSISETSDAEEIEAPLIDPDSTLYQIVKYTGKFHLMVLHFPIAFLLGCALGQWYRVTSGNGDKVVATMLWFGSIGAVGAAILGWMYAYDSVYFGDDEKTLFWHRWLGTGTAAVTLVVLLLRRKLGPKSLAIALTICAGLVAAAAHFGASLVYGTDFLKEF